MDLNQLNRSITALDQKAMEEAVQHWNNVAKPIGSLGQLEKMVTCIAGIQGTSKVNIEKRALLVLCSDNGVTAQGVAMTPAEVTIIMTEFIAKRRSSVGVMAEYAHTDLFTVDMGMFSHANVGNDLLLDRRVGDGTKDFTQGPAMTRKQAEQAIQIGIDLVRDRKAEGYRLLATGEMGIGNTTTSSAIATVLLGKEVSEVTGPGVGLDEEGLNRKINAITKGIECNKPDANDALDVLGKLGGFDIAAMAGVFIGGAIYHIPVLVDGVISSVAALVASRLCPHIRPYLLASHVSAEPAGSMVLDALGIVPLLHAGMRLGEGTGAVAIIPVLDMAIAVYDKVITYSDIGM
ncbi:MAG: nicotinate-nucleotide--dimethylbenzimidazole phosphoribosyltransferase [Clostridia bacterium]